MEGKHFEEFEVGQEYVSPWKWVSEPDFQQFLNLAGVQEPLFESRQFLEAETEFDRWVVPGYLTLTLSLGLFTRSGWIDGTGLAMLGAENLSFEGPVLVGDEIRTVVEVIEKTPTSSDRGGVVTLDWEIENDAGDTVVTMQSSHFIKKL